MKITIEYCNIEHSAEIGDELRIVDVELVVKRLMMSCGYRYNDETESYIITESNKILGVE